jgi:adenylate cyclase
LPLILVATTGDPSVRVPAGRTLVVGRSLDCDLSIRDPTVSRRHAEVGYEAGKLKVRDLGSTNGTFVNGQKGTEFLAPPGSRITFGKVSFDVREEPAFDSSVSAGESPLDATILRQVHVQGPGDIAARLAEAPPGSSVLRIGGASSADRQEQKLALLLDIARDLAQQTEVDRLLDRIVSLVFQVMNVDRVAVVMPGDGGELVPRVWRSRIGGPDEGRWHVPRSIARKTVDERVAMLIENAPLEAQSESGTVPVPTVRSALCAPLLGKQGTVLGLIYLDNLGVGRSFSSEDLDFLTAFSSMAAVAIENSQLLERVQREAVVLSNFQRYFAPDLVHQIAAQTDEIQLGGSRRRVAVLFADIRGFTALSEQMAPDEIAKLLTEYFTEMVDVVFEHGGILDKFMGDALMALWGAPVSREDDADRAMRAAIAMQQALQQLNADWIRQGRRTLSIGIGISLGDVFAGNIGSVRRLEYTVIGDAVNIASRLCSEAGPGDILVTEPLYAALAQPPRVSELTPLPLRGRAKMVGVYRVEW